MILNNIEEDIVYKLNRDSDYIDQEHSSNTITKGLSEISAWTPIPKLFSPTDTSKTSRNSPKMSKEAKSFTKNEPFTSPQLRTKMYKNYVPKPFKLPKVTQKPLQNYWKIDKITKIQEFSNNKKLTVRVIKNFTPLRIRTINSILNISPLKLFDTSPRSPLKIDKQN